MGKDGSSLLICPEKEEQYKALFDRLDVDKDGRVDVNELKQAFMDMRLPQVPGQAEVNINFRIIAECVFF